MKEEERLNDTVLHKNFVNRSYLLQRWQQLLEQGISAAGLIEFHTIHKNLLMAHSQAAYQPMRCLLSNIPAKKSMLYLNVLSMNSYWRSNVASSVNGT
ncbi:MAG: hypothetical protein JAY60_17090 [Candidatus Thiodiazotropha weberae]|nr:hypothetical protein [Candidatus Thiodiazotropha weberae]